MFLSNAPTLMVGSYQYIQIGVNSMKFNTNTNLEKTSYNSAIDKQKELNGQSYVKLTNSVVKA